MSLQASESPDKFVVDRRKATRNTDVAKAVRKTRERLAQTAGSPAYDAELIKLHARGIANNVAAVPVLAIALGLVAVFLGGNISLLLWPLVTSLCYLPLAFIARRYNNTGLGEIVPRSAAIEFLAAHFVTGLGWTYFATLECSTCGPDSGVLIKVVVLLIVIAATAVAASALRGAVLATFIVPVLVFGGVAFVASDAIAVVLFVLLVVALVFLNYIAGTMHQSSLLMLAFRTEKDALIAELETAKAISDEARSRAEEANMAKSRFLASMSHELRTPLNAILGFSEVMSNQILGPMPNDTYLEYSKDIHESGRHLLDLINEILDLSRIEAGRYQLNEEPINLVHAAEECCHMMELKARKKDIRIVTQFEEGMPKLFADERAMRQIILNLMANAVKFAPTGGEVRVRVGWTAGGGQYVGIKDNGPGIPESEIPVVLSTFGQGSIAIKHAEQGTGLGLPIVQSLIAVHGGEFKLISKLREGTEALAIFPAARVLEALPAMPTKKAGKVS